jgi:N-acetylmuramoyl-L-alanine amidase
MRAYGEAMKSLLIACALGLFLTVPAAAQSITDIRFGAQDNMTRVAIDANGALPYRAFVLGDPTRIVIDFPRVNWQAPTNKGDITGKISSYRASAYNNDTLRLVLETKLPMVVADHFRLPPDKKRPWRYVFDLKHADPITFRQNLNRVITGGGAAKSATKGTVTEKIVLPLTPPSKTLQKAPINKTKPLIVIDAGHGGIDPGARATNGTYEKIITLAVAREVKKILEAEGKYRVKMTRDTDIFIKLPDRVRIARKAGADLFISLHADTISRSAVQGASVYTLSDKASDAETAKLAARENAVDGLVHVEIGDVDAEVADILLDLVTRDTMNQSRVLAETVVGTFRGNGVSMLPQRPHRSAGFAVLKAPDVPSVLIEMGYLSNKAEASKLTNEEYRKKLARTISRVIDRYFTETSKRAAY